jgi:hypothetical protein
MTSNPPQQIECPSLAFPNGRSVLTVGEVAEKWRVTEQHVLNLITEGKLAAFDIAGKQDYVRAPISAIEKISQETGTNVPTLLEIIRNAKAKLHVGRAHWRIPVQEGFVGFMRENHSLVGR